MLIGSSRKLSSMNNITIYADVSVLDSIHSFTYLGVTINENLTWQDHVDKIYSKVLSKLSLLIKSSGNCQ